MLEICLNWAGWERTRLPTESAEVWTLDGPPPEGAFPGTPSSGGLEALFCRRGQLELELPSGRRMALGPGQVLFLPARAGECRCRFARETFYGVLVSGQEQGTLAALTAFCPGLEGPPSGAEHGCAVVEAALWSEALFAALDRLPAGRRGDYCAIKTVELLYLLHAGGSTQVRPVGSRYYDPYQLQTVRMVHDYMLEHLDQRLTIPQMSSRFRISSTMLKACFRQVYGASIHRYILNCRMARAAQLLASTRQPVIQVAEAVGYGSVSQFSAAFKARYRMSPGQYRRRAGKMSVSVAAGPIGSENAALEGV